MEGTGEGCGFLCSLKLPYLSTMFHLESQKWSFQGFSRVIFHRRCHVVSLEDTQDWEWQ